jgi:hypothetical protein
MLRMLIFIVLLCRIVRIKSSSTSSCVISPVEQKLVASDKEASAHFGISVALSGAGDVLAVGAYADDGDGTSDAGAVYLYTWGGAQWGGEQKLVASDKEVSALFGYSVALSDAGVVLAVGAYYDDGDGTSNAGAVYVYPLVLPDACLSGSAYDICAWQCELCSPGSFQPLPKTTSCIDAPPGTFVTEAGATSCSACETGTFQPDTRAATSSACIEAPPGTFVSTEGAGAFDECHAGSFSGAPGSTSSSTCLPVPAGAYSHKGNGTYSLCPAGHFSLAGAPTCTPCSPGSFTPMAGSAQCSLCAAGYFTNTTGAAVCSICPPGTTSHQGSMQCSECPVGTFGLGGGEMTTCMPCVPGTFSNTTGAAVCRPCPHGSEAAALGATSCDVCDGH